MFLRNDHADITVHKLFDCFPDLFVVDVDCDSLAEDQLHGGRMTKLHRGFHDQVDPFVRHRDTVQVDGVVDGWIPGTHSRHLRVIMRTYEKSEYAIDSSHYYVISHTLCYLIIAVSDDGKVEERASVLFGKNWVHAGSVRTRQLIIHCQVISCKTDKSA